jgi:nucleoid-associated protein EbfC
MDLKKIMEAASQMQSKMADAQAGLADLQCEGQSGAGLVKVTVNGAGAAQHRRLAVQAGR